MNEPRSTAAPARGEDAGSRAPEDADPVVVSRRLLDAVRTGDGVDDALATLAALDDEALTTLWEERRVALAFWVNCYNAGTQLLLDRRPGLYEGPFRTVRFFGADCLTVGGTALSLDDIEHGILRGSRSKYGLGYLPRLLTSDFERRYRLDDVDERIHFALNCGAASCPAIRYYEPSRVDEQLSLATETYLDETVQYNPDADVVRVPRVFRWYRGDFGGRADIVAFLRRFDALPADAFPRIRHRSWDWTRTPGKFAGEE